MNKWIGSGFISSDIKMETINTKDGKTLEKARFSIACQKKSRNGGANFIQVVALGDMATTINKWFSKGKGIYVECEINTGSYTHKEGKKIYTEEKVITSWEFPPIKKNEEQVQEQQAEPTTGNQPSAPDDFVNNIPDDLDDMSLPFR